MSTPKRIFISFKFSDSRPFAETLAELLIAKGFEVDICIDPNQNNRSIFEFEQKITTDDFVVFIVTNPWARSFDCAYEASRWFLCPSNHLNAMFYVAPDFDWDFYCDGLDVESDIFGFPNNADRVRDAHKLPDYYLSQVPHNSNLYGLARTYLNTIREHYKQFLNAIKGVSLRPYQVVKKDVFITTDNPTPLFSIGSELHDYVNDLTCELENMINETPKSQPIPTIYKDDFCNPSPVWLPDAENARTNQSVRYSKYYENSYVTSFLNNSSILCVTAVKGIGKTFLLQIKRTKMGSLGYIILPHGTPSCDNDWGTARITISDNYRICSFCTSDSIDTVVKNFENLWNITIALYIICEHRYYNSQDKGKLICYDLWEKFQNKSANSFNDINSIISRHSSQDSVNLSALQEMIIRKISDYKSPSTIQSTLADWSYELRDVLYQYVAYYDCPFCVFIDKVDTAFDYLHEKISMGNGNSSNNVSISDIYQFGLYKAAISLKKATTNKVLIYHAIRQETLDIMQPLLGAAVGKDLSNLIQLKYNDKDLECIFRKTVELQTPEYFLTDHSSDILERFLGVSVLQHPCCKTNASRDNSIPVNETLFECINRHSFGATRDLQYFGMKLSSMTYRNREGYLHTPNVTKVTMVKKAIEDAAADLLFDDPYCAYIPRKKDLMPNRYTGNPANYEPLKYLLRLFDRNFLKFEDIKYIHRRFCEKYGDDSHPISTLYRLGLLGILTVSNVNDDYYTQQFAPPHKIGYFTDSLLETIENTRYFLLHPSVTKYLVRENAHEKFYRFNGFIIGRNYTVKGSDMSHIEKSFRTISNIAENPYYTLFSPMVPLSCSII